MRENPKEYLDYSIVPDYDEIITIGERKCILSHAFCTMASAPLSIDEDEVRTDVTFPLSSRIDEKETSSNHFPRSVPWGLFCFLRL